MNDTRQYVILALGRDIHRQQYRLLQSSLAKQNDLETSIRTVHPTSKQLLSLGSFLYGVAMAYREESFEHIEHVLGHHPDYTADDIAPTIAGHLKQGLATYCDVDLDIVGYVVIDHHDVCTPTDPQCANHDKIHYSNGTARAHQCPNDVALVVARTIGRLGIRPSLAAVTSRSGNWAETTYYTAESAHDDEPIMYTVAT